MDGILQSLFQALARDPQEEAIRWILADRLEELGFDQQAQFIRIQCQLAQLQGPPAFFSGDFLYTQLNWQPRDFRALSVDSLTIDDHCSHYHGTIRFGVSTSVWWRAGKPNGSEPIGIQINDQTTSYQMRFLASIDRWELARRPLQIDVRARIVPWSYLGAGHEKLVHWFSLKEQENQLLKDNERLGNPWIPLVRPFYYFPNYYVDYERGFVKTLCLPCDTFVQLAGQIFTHQPVIQTVLLSDCRPYCLENEAGTIFYSWQREEKNTNHSRYRPACLPPALFDRLAASDAPVLHQYFLRQENAVHALSAACIAYGKEQALIYPNGSLSSV